MLVKLAYWRERWEKGIKSSVYWDTKACPHILISGITGGGKTVLSQIILNQVLNSNAKIFIADFKAGGDWDGILVDYGEYLECDRIINLFYDRFLSAIQEKKTNSSEHYLLFDEFSSYALSKDAKEFKELMGKLAHVAFMGRSFSYHLILISQQFSAKVIDTSIREQFGIKVYMGSTISTESATMLFPNSEVDKSVHLPKCCGYISMPERELGIIQIPYIREPHKLKQLLINKGQVTFNKAAGRGEAPSPALLD